MPLKVPYSLIGNLAISKSSISFDAGEEVGGRLAPHRGPDQRTIPADVGGLL